MFFRQIPLLPIGQRVGCAILPVILSVSPHQLEFVESCGQHYCCDQCGILKLKSDVYALRHSALFPKTLLEQRCRRGCCAEFKRVSQFVRQPPPPPLLLSLSPKKDKDAVLSPHSRGGLRVKSSSSKVSISCGSALPSPDDSSTAAAAAAGPPATATTCCCLHPATHTAWPSMPQPGVLYLPPPPPFTA